MYRAKLEHFEMAAKAFTSAGKAIDVDVLEKFANILAVECAGRSAIVKELSELKRPPPVYAVPPILGVDSAHGVIARYNT